MSTDTIRQPSHAEQGGAAGPAGPAVAPDVVTATNAVDRALSVLCAFSRETPALGVTELSERLDLTKSTVHRLLQLLLARGMVAREAGLRRYTLGYRVLALARAVPGEATLRQMCRPHMVALRAATDETIGLYVAAGDVRMCLEELESAQVLRMAAGVGRCFPLSRGAASKALLAAASVESDRWQRAVASLSAHERERLAGDLDELHQRGYVITYGETVPGCTSIAAPIYAADGTVAGALNVAGPASRFDAATRTRHAALLLQTVAAIARDLATATAQPASLGEDRR